MSNDKCVVKEHLKIFNYKPTGYGPCFVGDENEYACVVNEEVCEPSTIQMNFNGTPANVTGFRGFGPSILNGINSNNDNIRRLASAARILDLNRDSVITVDEI